LETPLPFAKVELQSRRAILLSKDVNHQVLEKLSRENLDGRKNPNVEGAVDLKPASETADAANPFHDRGARPGADAEHVS
jgi:predicted lipoprotein